MPQPLSSRVSADLDLREPEHPEVAEWRPMTIDDAPIVLELAQSTDRSDHPEYLSLSDEIDDMISRSFVELARDSILGFDHAGTAIAWALVTETPGQQTLVRVFLDGGVRPSHRGHGIGRVVLEWQHARALQRLAAHDDDLPGWVVSYADERATQTGRLFRRAGFSVARYFLAAERVLAEPITDVPLTEGITLVPFNAEYAQAAHEARDDAFRDHWGSQPHSDEQWQTYLNSASFRPELSVLALAGSGEGDGAGDRVVGFVLSNVYEQDWETQGFSSAYLAMVGVVRDWRRRGIAPALLTAALRACREAGLERVTLDVDADNPSGALGLYHRIGFRETQRELAFVREY